MGSFQPSSSVSWKSGPGRHPRQAAGRKLGQSCPESEASGMAVAGTAGTWAGRGAVSVQLSPANWEPSLLDQREKGPKSPSPGTLGRSSRERYPPMLPTVRGLYLSRLSQVHFPGFVLF